MSEIAKTPALPNPTLDLSEYEEIGEKIRSARAVDDVLSKLDSVLRRAADRGSFGGLRSRNEWDRWREDLAKSAESAKCMLLQHGFSEHVQLVEKSLLKVEGVDPDKVLFTFGPFSDALDLSTAIDRWFRSVGGEAQGALAAVSSCRDVVADRINWLHREEHAAHQRANEKHQSALAEYERSLEEAKREIPPTDYLLPRLLPFDSLAGHEFEGLVYAHLEGLAETTSVEWYGQSGDDKGCDIWSVEKSGKRVCYLCANHQRLSASKIKADLSKLEQLPRGLPDRVVCVTGCRKVSAGIREKAEAHAAGLGIAEFLVWSGDEFEITLRTANKKHLFETFGHRFPHRA